MLRSLVAVSVVSVVSLTAACGNAATDALSLVDPTVRPDVAHPELSVLDDGSVLQRYLVQVRGDLFAEGLADSVIAQIVVEDELRLEHVYTRVYGGFAVALTDEQVRRLAGHPEIEAVVADVRMDAVKGRPVAPTLPPTDWGVRDVLVDPAARHDGTGTSVIVLDSGVTAHPSLPTATCIGNFSSDVGTDCTDGDGHGTHVSGTIAAAPSAGHQGIAPGATLGSAKVLSSSGSGSTAGIVAAINAAAGSWDVLNLSLGGAAYGSEASDPLCVAIANARAAGTVSAVAAGNDARDASTFSPARCDAAITVAAHDVNLRSASFTNTGADVDVSAPGVSITSTTMDGSFGRMSGTSMASPHVAGVAALYKATHPDATADEVVAGVLSLSSDRAAPSAYSRKISVSAPMLDGSDYNP